MVLLAWVGAGIIVVCLVVLVVYGAGVLAGAW